MGHKAKSIPLAPAIIVVATVLLSAASCAGDGRVASDRITVTLAAPQSAYIEDFDSNVYKLWLEEQTGLDIEMVWLPTLDAEQAVMLALSEGRNLPDAYVGFGSSSYSVFSNTNLQRYGEQGVVIALNDYIGRYGDNLKQLYAELPEYDIEGLMNSADGNIYFMPGFSSSQITRSRQMMWVNKGWLDALGLAPPTTADGFADMLRAFKAAYPDRIPMAGTDDHYSKQPYDFLINAFVYNDNNNSRLLLDDGVVGFAPVTDEWREALVYLRGLYDEGLYSPLSFTQGDQQLGQMANDSRDILGAFASPGITLTVYQNSPEMLERYAGIAPLAGPGGVRLTTVFAPVPRPNGVITSACEHPEEVFKLFDLMLSEEACLMGRYGERGVDWEFAAEGEVSIYGTQATIRILNQIWNTPQNKHLAQIVPYVSRPKYSGGVTWDGNATDGEYMNAQSAVLHTPYEPLEYIATLIFTPEEETQVRAIREGIEVHVKRSVVDFITGARDIRDDAEWRAYRWEFDDLGLATFLRVAQDAVDRVQGG
jgi:putative aldouronate transport system substrate-binding protein